MRWRWWVVAGIGAIILALVPVIWLLILHIEGVQLVRAQDPFGLIATLSAIAGAIFTAAGLVTALAAVVTVLTVEERVKRSFEAQLPSLVEQADKQIEANTTFLLARAIGDWRQQVQMARQAIQQYAGLRYKVSSFMATRIANIVIGDFAKEHTRLGITYTGPPHLPPKPDDALHQIWEAQSSGEDPDGELKALEALMYAANREVDAMINSIRHGKRNSNNRILEHLTSAPRLAMLVYACGSDR